MKGTNKLLTALVSVALIGVSHLAAQDFSVKVSPQVFVPFAEQTAGGEQSFFSVGGGTLVIADLALLNFLSANAQLGINLVPPLGIDRKVMTLTNAGLGASFFVYPISRLKLSASGYAGVYGASYDTLSTSNWFWKAGISAGYRLSPLLTLNAFGDYQQYMYSSGTLVTGVGAGLSLDLNISALAGSDNGVEIQQTDSKQIFPVFFSSYDTDPIATVKVTNLEQSEVENVVVSFQAGSYTDGPKASAKIPLLARGASVEVPIYASFKEAELLGLSEDTKVQGEVQVAYNLLDAPRQRKETVVVSIHHRNALFWKGDQILSAFTSPNDPAVLEYTKFVAGLVRNKIRSEIDKNLQYGMGVFESLRLGGIAYSADPTTPYKNFHGSQDKVDYLQFPYQTLAYRSGDSDDLSVLYAAALTSIGVDCAFITYDDEAAVAIKINMDEATAKANFSDPSLLIYAENAVWVPVEISAMREGFMRAWQIGSQKWNATLTAAKKPDFFSLEEGWAKFPAVGVPGIESKVAKPAEDQINLAIDNTMTRFVAQEIGPKVKKLQSEMLPGKTTPKQYNSLGLLYARYGMYAEAKGQFEKAAADNYVPAIVNLGNVAMLERRYEDAVTIYQKALTLQPDNKAAMIGLAQAKYELNDFEDSDKLVSQVRAVDPALADKYAYLASRTEGNNARASSAADRSATAWDETGD